MIGQTFGGKFKVLRLLGEGGMGAVYEGEQQLGTTKRKVAVKTLHPHLSRDPNVQARFEREVGTIAELEHPNTIQVYDFGKTPDGILYIVMEFLSGKSVADVLVAEGPLSAERTGRILQQVCGSLAEAHGRGIIHRDLKPDNVVLLERAGQKDFVKVLDFGIAKRSSEEDKNEQKLTQQGMVLGTPPYMSPEQFTGRPIDARSDIYSLGVMAFEMLTGTLPFVANTAWEWASQHMTQPPIPIESLPEGGAVPASARSAIKRALAKTPEERFASVAEFGSAFVQAGPALAAGGTVPIASPGPARQKTEIGTPLDVAAAFGARATALQPSVGAPVIPAGVIGASPVAGYTPIGGNVAFPTPPAIPQSPAYAGPKSSGRGLILGLAGVIALASIGAIVFAVRSRGGSRAEPLNLGSVAVAASTSLAPVPPPPADTGSAGAPGASADDVPPLQGGGVPPGGGGRPRPNPGPAPSPNPAPNPGPPPGPNPGPAPNPKPGPGPAPKPAAYNGPECDRARKLRALGRPEADAWALKCIALGGNPN
jgi:serine/threonine-protein kinase